MPSKSMKSGKVRPISPVTAEGAADNVVDHQALQATTEMGVPIAPDHLYPVSESLYASLQTILAQREQLNRLIGEKAHAAGLALGAKGDSQIVLTADMQFIAVYDKASIDRANAEAMKELADAKMVQPQK